ncbi:MAG TPA: hypothetical protein VOB72_00605, partial [Candidatus Dormibacteraeota bacterium]|nr:hypothetical protein [Candidatus Dormibacteraeota bacterium]
PAGVVAPSRPRAAAARVSADELRKVRHVFQPPAAYDRAHDALRDHRLALLYGPAGLGKYTSALHLLMGAEAPEVQVIDPALDVHELLAFPFEDGCRYVLDAAGPRRLARFSQPSVERLGELLDQHDARLVVTVDRGAEPVGEPALSGVRALVVAFDQGPDKRAVLTRHLDWYLEGATVRVEPAGLAARPEIVRVLESISSPADVDRLARVLVPVVRDGAELGISLTRFDTVAMHEVEEWFRTERSSLADCSLLIATAVLNGASHHAVAAAADDLHERLWKREHPGEDGPPRAVFEVPRDERFRAVEATISGGYQHTEFGASPVDVVTLVNPSWQRAVLRHVWREYDQGRDCLVRWLRGLGRHPQPDVRQRVAGAVGELAGRDFAYVCDEILESWGADDREDVRKAAATALGVAAHGDGSSLVYNLLGNWATALDRRAQWTAATTFGGWAGQRFPNIALGWLESIVEDVSQPGLQLLTDEAVDLLDAVGRSVKLLFESGTEYHGVLLWELVRWTDRQRAAAMVIVAEFFFLHLALHSNIRDPEDAHDWPAVLWLMETDDRAREHVLMLWARCFRLPETRQEALEVLLEWVRQADDAPGLYPALERAMLRIRAALPPDDRDRIAHYLGRLARERPGKSASVERLLIRLSRGG